MKKTILVIGAIALMLVPSVIGHSDFLPNDDLPGADCPGMIPNGPKPTDEPTETPKEPKNPAKEPKLPISNEDMRFIWMPDPTNPCIQ